MTIQMGLAFGGNFFFWIGQAVDDFGDCNNTRPNGSNYFSDVVSV